MRGVEFRGSGQSRPVMQSGEAELQGPSLDLRPTSAPGKGRSMPCPLATMPMDRLEVVCCCSTCSACRRTSGVEREGWGRSMGLVCAPAGFQRPAAEVAAALARAASAVPQPPAAHNPEGSAGAPRAACSVWCMPGLQGRRGQGRSPSRVRAGGGATKQVQQRACSPPPCNTHTHTPHLFEGIHSSQPPASQSAAVACGQRPGKLRGQLRHTATHQYGPAS